MSAEYFYYCCKFIKSKKIYTEAVIDGYVSRSYLKNMYNNLKSVLVKKIKSKKSFKRIMKFFIILFSKFRQMYDPISEMECLKLRVSDLRENLLKIQENTNSNEDILKEVSSLIKKIKSCHDYNNKSSSKR